MEHTVVSDGARISYSIEGRPGAPALVLSHSLGTTRDLWARQATAFAGAFRVVRYDTRGHGDSSAPSADCTIDQLGRDLLAVLDDAGIAQAHVCGLSLGGQTAMWLALHQPERLGRIVLANTGARLGSEEFWNERIALVKAAGMAGVADRSVGVWFTPEFRERDADTVHDFKAMLQDCSVDGYVGACGVLRDTDFRDALGRIRCPTLAIAGSADAAVPLDAMEQIRDQVPGARLVTLDAAHLSNVEQAEAFTGAVLEFLA